MKITEKESRKPNYVQLSFVNEGEVVQFKSPFSGVHRADDLFIVNAVCNSYVPECVTNRNYYDTAGLTKLEHGEKYDRRVHLHPHAVDEFGGNGVTNLRTGRLSFVVDTQKVLIVKAEVTLLGPKECKC